ncbi:MAG: hypothetical protein JM58_03780 [Peptococcaceae bacterium BICA1-8]|nr:MAG: hypothetical protein JM58_03780 [Peptococcaceae bacterium BICA1-8]
MKNYIIKSVSKVGSEWVEKFSLSDVSTVYEAQGKIGLLHNRLKPIIDGSFICGPVVTAICPAGDNLMIHAAVEVCSPGDILVVAIIGESNAGMIGELLVSGLQKKGVKGIIIDAGTRDVDILRKMNFPVWTKAIYSRGTYKCRPGWVNAPAVCGEYLINPGDLIMADDDGVVVVRKEDVQSVWEKANQRMMREEEVRKKIASGEISLDYNDLRTVLKQNNVIYYENEDHYKAENSAT